MKPQKRGLKTLLRELSDDDSDSELPTATSRSEDPENPWKQQYNAYMDAVHDLPEGMSTIEWWGVRAFTDILSQ